jgi:hypothetical protein
MALAWCLVALLLAGAPAAAHVAAPALEQRGFSQTQARSDGARCDLPVAAVYRLDLEDGPDPLSLRFAPGVAVSCLARHLAPDPRAYTVPLARRPCARPPTGPPSA